jgi:CRP-like cAMP-binding protein
MSEFTAVWLRLRVRLIASGETSMGRDHSVSSYLAVLLPDVDAATLRRLSEVAQREAFRRRDLLNRTGNGPRPYLMLSGYVMFRRLAETGQVSAALIAGPGYLGGIRSISDPGGEPFYELVALTDGLRATWDPQAARDLALKDPALAVGLLDRSWDFAMTLNVRLDERTFENARQRLAAILTRYGEVIFDTPHPVAKRADLAAMIGTSQVMMHRALRQLEAEGLVQRDRSGGIRILDEERLASLMTVAPPEGAPPL